MRALRFNAADGVRLVEQAVPQPGSDQALVRVLRAGVCSTDLEITKGYVPGKDRGCMQRLRGVHQLALHLSAETHTAQVWQCASHMKQRQFGLINALDTFTLPAVVGCKVSIMSWAMSLWGVWSHASQLLNGKGKSFVER